MRPSVCSPLAISSITVAPAALSTTRLKLASRSEFRKPIAWARNLRSAKTLSSGQNRARRAGAKMNGRWRYWNGRLTSRKSSPMMSRGCRPSQQSGPFSLATPSVLTSSKETFDCRVLVFSNSACNMNGWLCKYTLPNQRLHRTVAAHPPVLRACR